MDSRKPIYGNWVSNKLLRRVVTAFIVIAAADILLWVFVPNLLAFKIMLAAIAALLDLSLVYFLIARHYFSEDGGNVQSRILDILLEHIDWDGDGSSIDIGCGAGALTIKTAKKYENARITGVDYWGGAWAYSKKRCEENSEIEGTADRTEFIKASASKLPFPDETFDLAVSNLTFHEVQDSPNKLDLVLEALRVVKTGGRFVFQDLFLWRACYGDMKAFMDALKQAGIREVSFIDSSKASFIPALLRLPFMVGTLGILYGVK